VTGGNEQPVFPGVLAAAPAVEGTWNLAHGGSSRLPQATAGRSRLARVFAAQGAQREISLAGGGAGARTRSTCS
jgi:hypothetical protein